MSLITEIRMRGHVYSKKNRHIIRILAKKGEIIVNDGKTIYKKIGLGPDYTYEKWERDSSNFIATIAEITGLKPIDYPVRVKAVNFFKGVEPDVVNVLQSIGDALERSGVIKNDRLIKSWDGSRCYRAKKNEGEGIVIEVFPFDLKLNALFGKNPFIIS